MSLSIQDEIISSDNTRHTARLAPGERAWQVSWLPGRLMDRNSAITAMVLADVAGTDDVHAGHRLWPTSKAGLPNSACRLPTPSPGHPSHWAA